MRIHTRSHNSCGWQENDEMASQMLDLLPLFFQNLCMSEFDKACDNYGDPPAGAYFDTYAWVCDWLGRFQSGARTFTFYRGFVIVENVQEPESDFNQWPVVVKFGGDLRFFSNALNLDEARRMIDLHLRQPHGLPGISRGYDD